MRFQSHVFSGILEENTLIEAKIIMGMSPCLRADESRPDNLDVIGGGREIGLETRDERPPFLAGIADLTIGIDEGITCAGLVGRHGKRRLAVVKQRPAGR